MRKISDGRYRFQTETIDHISIMLTPGLGMPCRRGMPLVIEVLIFLHYVTTGSFQIVVGELVNVAKSTVCRAACERVAACQAKLEPF